MDSLLFLKAVLMGIVEGLTEFIPVSSTGHLVLFGHWIGFEGAQAHSFDIIIQLGAILAVCWVYRAKLWAVAVGLPREREAQAFARNVALAFLPAAVAGFFLHDRIEAALFNPRTIAFALTLGGLAILLIERGKRTARFDRIETLPLMVVLAIGCIQSIALVPGVSRSGATIMGALLLGVERKAAAEFSFFLAIPTMLGATTLSLYKHWHAFSADDLGVIAIGFVSAFISALIVVRWLIGFVSRRDFQPFGWYRIGLGILVLWVIA